jgi:hypothetical protein
MLRRVERLAGLAPRVATEGAGDCPARARSLICARRMSGTPAAPSLRYTPARPWPETARRYEQLRRALAQHCCRPIVDLRRERLGRVIEVRGVGPNR